MFPWRWFKYFGYFFINIHFKFLLKGYFSVLKCLHALITLAFFTYCLCLFGCILNGVSVSQHTWFWRLYTQASWLHNYFCNWLGNRCKTLRSFASLWKFHWALFAWSIVIELCCTVYIFLLLFFYWLTISFIFWKYLLQWFDKGRNFNVRLV